MRRSTTSGEQTTSTVRSLEMSDRFLSFLVLFPCFWLSLMLWIPCTACVLLDFALHETLTAFSLDGGSIPISELGPLAFALVWHR